jgi:hypothetical protein
MVFAFLFILSSRLQTPTVTAIHKRSIGVTPVEFGAEQRWVGGPLPSPSSQPMQWQGGLMFYNESIWTNLGIFIVSKQTARRRG